MKKVFIKILGGFISIILILQCNVFVYADDVSDLQNEQASNEEKLKDTEEQKEQVTQEKSETLQQVEQLQSQISDYENQINELDTKIARSILPESISVKDAAYNIRKCSMLIDAVYRQDAELMKKCLYDKLHQPYRERLIKGFKELKELLANKDDILGCVISGAGPTILVISKNDGFEKVENEVKKIFEDLNVNCDIRTFNIENEGTKVI